MITNGQEVSAYGNGGKGNDSNFLSIYKYLDDNWILECLNKKSG
jgi:hypothetical protein